MKNIVVMMAVNLTYSGLTYNTPLRVEYKHTGELTLKKGRKKVKSPGYYFMYRLAIPTITAEGKKDYWYINNPGDHWVINKVSKYGRKIHKGLSENNPAILKAFELQ